MRRIRKQSAGLLSRRLVSPQVAEHDLEAVAPLGTPLVVFHRLLFRRPAGDADVCASVFKSLSTLICFMTLIRKQPIGLGQAARKRCRTGAAACLACGRELRDQETIQWTVSPETRIGRPVASETACSLVFMPPVVCRICRLLPPFCTQAGSRAMHLEIGGIDHDRLARHSRRPDPSWSGRTPLSLHRFQRF